jgi:hypothetical protein
MNVFCIMYIKYQDKCQSFYLLNGKTFASD